MEALKEKARTQQLRTTDQFILLNGNHALIPLLPESFSNYFSYSNVLTPLRVPRQWCELE
jgi:hypothetical protein